MPRGRLAVEGKQNNEKTRCSTILFEQLEKYPVGAVVGALVGAGDWDAAGVATGAWIGAVEFHGGAGELAADGVGGCPAQEPPPMLAPALVVNKVAGL